MRSSSVAKFFVTSAAMFSLVPCASAWISDFTAPITPLKIGEYFNATFETSDYIQNNAQHYALFGLVPAENAGDARPFLFTLLGTGFDFVSHDFSEVGGHEFINVTLQIPESATSGQYALTTSVLTTVGASELVSLKNWTTPVTVA